MKKSNTADKTYYEQYDDSSDEYVTEIVRTERKDTQSDDDREATRQEVLNTYLTAKKTKQKSNVSILDHLALIGHTSQNNESIVSAINKGLKKLKSNGKA